jgi:hypothetical protein
MIAPTFRDVEPELPTLISRAKGILGKFFSKLIGRNGGTAEDQDIPKPDENLEQVDAELEKIKMP